MKKTIILLLLALLVLPQVSSAKIITAGTNIIVQTSNAGTTDGIVLAKDEDRMTIHINSDQRQYERYLMIPVEFKFDDGPLVEYAPWKEELNYFSPTVANNSVVLKVTDELKNNILAANRVKVFAYKNGGYDTKLVIEGKDLEEWKQILSK